ncbi:hypothetical protein CBL_10982 [Carabus blaptoides fortunei]
MKHHWDSIHALLPYLARISSDNTPVLTSSERLPTLSRCRDKYQYNDVYTNIKKRKQMRYPASSRRVPWNMDGRKQYKDRSRNSNRTERQGGTVRYLFCHLYQFMSAGFSSGPDI